MIVMKFAIWSVVRRSWLRRRVFTKPRIAVMGVRSSWLVIATKSDFI